MTNSSGLSTVAACQKISRLAKGLAEPEPVADFGSAHAHQVDQAAGYSAGDAVAKGALHVLTAASSSFAIRRNLAPRSR